MRKRLLEALFSLRKKTKALTLLASLAILLTGSGLAFAAISIPFADHFSSSGVLSEASDASQSSSLTWWLQSGSKLTIVSGVAETVQGAIPSTSPVRKTYATSYPVASDSGAHPQNVFQMFFKGSVKDPAAQIYFKRIKDNLTNAANRSPYIGESVLVRYQNENNYYYGGLRADGAVVIKKKTGGKYQTLAYKKLLSGTYSATTNYDLIPLDKWIGLKLVAVDGSTGPQLSLYTDIGRTGTWTLAISAIDTPAKYGAEVPNSGTIGIRSDFADAQFDDFYVSDPPPASVPSVAPSSAPAPAPTPTPSTSSGAYDSVVLADKPVMYLKMNSANSGKETDASGRGHTGTYKGGTPSSASLPNGDSAAVFNGSSQYLTVPSSADFSIPTTRALTWEAWIRPDTLNFSTASDDGYVDWMGKCEDYSPTCEWEARIYNAVTAENRPDRLSAYVFNSSAGLGSAADWQPQSNLISAGKWIHVVAEYQTGTTPSGCDSSSPGTINIWVDGVKQSFADHAPTGCMSQYGVKPQSNSSALDIGTMAMDTWFKGAIGKVAIYNHLLTQTQINAHFKTMSGKSPSGTCGATCSAVMP